MEDELISNTLTFFILCLFDWSHLAISRLLYGLRNTFHPEFRFYPDFKVKERIHLVTDYILTIFPLSILRPGAVVITYTYVAVGR
jgi:hypothetical protein